MTTNCPACGGARVVEGRLSGTDWPASFQPHDIKFVALQFPFVGTPSSIPLEQASACAHCGHLWTQVAPAELQALIEKWGNPALKSRILAPDKDAPP